MLKLLSFVLFVALFPAIAVADDDVSCVQGYLAQTAFDPGPVDGQWGRRTAAAIKDFFSQINTPVAGGLERSNVSEICAVFEDDVDGALLAMGQFRRYPIAIDAKALADIDPTYFDFSEFELYTGPDLNCAFSFITDIRNGSERWERIHGRVNIVSSRLEFQSHSYKIGDDQLADESYLKERSNLKLLQSGQVVGRTPYFWDYIQPGQVSRRPVDARLSKSFQPGSSLPNGASQFEIPDFADIKGILELQYCRER